MYPFPVPISQTPFSAGAVSVAEVSYSLRGLPSPRTYKIEVRECFICVVSSVPGTISLAGTMGRGRWRATVAGCIAGPLDTF